MKKLNILLITLIIANCISICPFAFEAVGDEADALSVAEEYVKNCYANMYIYTEYDVLKDTVAGLDDSQKNEISEKAKEYENEIRKNHRYHYYEDNQWYHDMEKTDENGIIGHVELDPDVIPPAKQYDKTAIEDVISSFPVFIEKKIQYRDSLLHSHTKEFRQYEFDCAPQSVIIGNNGFAYVNMNYYANFHYDDKFESSGFEDEIYVLLYRFANGQWVVCDVSTYWDYYDEKYRFKSQMMDVERELSVVGCRLSSKYETTYSYLSADESENEANNASQGSEPINYTPWVICTAEAVAILALAIALVFKKKK